VTRITGFAAAALAVAVVIAVIGTSRNEAEPPRAAPAVAAGQAEATRILELPVPLHQAAREALVAIREARLALAGQDDRARLAAARAHVQHARVTIAAFEADQGVSAEQRTAIANLNRQLQRLLIDIDSST